LARPPNRKQLIFYLLNKNNSYGKRNKKTHPNIQKNNHPKSLRLKTKKQSYEKIGEDEKGEAKYGYVDVPNKTEKEETSEEYDKQLDKILEDKEWDSYFEERIDQTEKDTEIILNCLRYCRHRLQKHPESGIHKADVKLKDIKRLIKELE